MVSWNRREKRKAMEIMESDCDYNTSYTHMYKIVKMVLNKKKVSYHII